MRSGPFKMNVGRVTYECTPVLIQHVDETTKMARIYSRKDPENERDVPVLN
jgi:small acid-soluble spore protein H (minor)